MEREMEEVWTTRFELWNFTTSIPYKMDIRVLTSIKDEKIAISLFYGFQRGFP